MKSVIRSLIICLAFVHLASCGSKKKIVDRSREKTSTEINLDQEFKQDQVINTSTIIDSTVFKLTLIPKDPERPIIIQDPAGNVTEVTNAEVIIEKADVNTQEETTEETTTEARDNSTIDQKKDTRETHIDVERESGAGPWIALAILILIIIIAFWYLRRPSRIIRP